MGEVNKSYAFFQVFSKAVLFKMSKENCFSHLKKRFDEKSEEWQKTWDFLPDTVSLADKVLEELKLVGAMEEDIAAKQLSEQELLKAQNQKQRETQEISQKSDQLTVEKNELEKLKNELNSKQESRDEKLKVLQQKINAKKENSDREREKSDVYGQRIKEFLGLQIVETTTGSTVLIFNNIDKIDPERKYLCEFTLDGPDKRAYKVLKSEPMLDDLTELENTLNQTNDLSGFVTKLRLKFQQYSLANV